MEALLRPEDTVIFTTPLSERAAQPADLLEYANVNEKEAVDEPRTALERGMALAEASVTEGKETVLICAGSLYLIGYLRAFLKSEKC